MRNYKYPNHSRAVAEFTSARLGHNVPDGPSPLNEMAVRKLYLFSFASIFSHV
jgi:hypothetical protein